MQVQLKMGRDREWGTLRTPNTPPYKSSLAFGLCHTQKKYF